MTEPPVDSDPLVRISGLVAEFPVADGRSLVAVNDVSLEIGRGEVLGIVGESGSGKSVLGLSLLGLVAAPGVVSGSIRIDGVEVIGASQSSIRRLRGSTIGLVLQDPTASLNPLRTVASQLAESLAVVGVKGAEARRRVAEGLRSVGLEPARVLRKRPFQLSGGMNQRIAIAMAILQRPKILIADEPTTALDVVVQLEVLELLRSLQRDLGMALVVISHDLAVVDQLADRVVVMYGGRLVESGGVDDVVREPAHPYTRALLDSMPTLSADQKELQSIPGQFRPLFTRDAGCPFVDRCPLARAECSTEFPATTAVSETHDARCWALQPAQTQPAQLEPAQTEPAQTEAAR